MMNKKAAIELSATAIVTIIISIVIITLGVILFYNLVASADKYKESVDQRVQQQLRDLILSQNNKVAVYPTDINIQNGKAGTVTVAVQNNLDERKGFQSERTPNMIVYYYENSTDDGVLKSHWAKDNVIGSSTPNDKVTLSDCLPSKEYAYRNVLIKMPNDSARGLYVITFKVQNFDCGSGENQQDYGVVNIYVNNN